MQKKAKSIVIGNDQQLIFETGKIAKQANGAVSVRLGDTMVFASACASPKADEGVDFLPLRVDYQEKFFSAGKTLGGFIKREGRPTEKEVLVSRLIDRPLRPMFPDGYYNEVQILSYVWSYDGINQPDVLAICCASAALIISDIPFVKPVAAVRVGFIKGAFCVNPSVEQMQSSDLDLVLAGTEDAILMIEGYCNFLTEQQVLDAIEFGHLEIKKICHALKEWAHEVGKEKASDQLSAIPENLLKWIDKNLSKSMKEILHVQCKKTRDKQTADCQAEAQKKLLEEGEFSEVDIGLAFKKTWAKHMRSMILDEGVRADGRGVEDIRSIDIEMELLPRSHGSCLFTRGETQSLAVCTLGGESMGQRFEDLDGEGLRRFYLQYFFPPFSVGEVGKSGSPGRREIGHGKLAERALSSILPTLESFPYTIRLESNITESNGSSSMASVCGGCLALMDAGVPINKPVAGIAMGLILEDHKVAILSDILGLEDALGDMDFKVAGNGSGITAFQMDIKVEGITLRIMDKALKQAQRGLSTILKKMLDVRAHPKKELSIYAPRIETMQISPSKIAIVIGPGGKQIRSIIEQTGVQIDINDSGLVSISSSNPEAMSKAKRIISDLTSEVEVGKVYDGKVVSVVPFGVFVEVLPGKEGLCHISELSDTRIQDINAHIKEGAILSVKVLEINDRGQVRLSHKVLLKKS